MDETKLLGGGRKRGQVMKGIDGYREGGRREKNKNG